MKVNSNQTQEINKQATEIQELQNEVDALQATEGPTPAPLQYTTLSHTRCKGSNSFDTSGPLEGVLATCAAQSDCKGVVDKACSGNMFFVCIKGIKPSDENSDTSYAYSHCFHEIV